MSFGLRKCLEPFRIACCLRKALPQRCCPVLRALRTEQVSAASWDPTREACVRPLAGLRMIWGPIGGRRQDLRTGRARTSNLAAANGPPRTAPTGLQCGTDRVFCQGPTLNRRVAGRTTVLWIALWMPLGQSTTEIVKFCVINCHRYCRVSWCLISFMRFIMRDLSGSSWDSSLFHEFILSENIIGRFLGRLYVFVVKRLRIGAFGISVTSPAASASPSGAGPSRRIRLLFRCIQNSLG